MDEEYYKEVALEEARAEGCRCDPDIEAKVETDEATGCRLILVQVEHEEDCPYLLIRMAPWN